jgi:hypothetical protein
MDQNKIYILQKAQETLESFKDNIGKMENKDIKIMGSSLQQQLLSAYWIMQHYLETLDITGFPVKILDMQTMCIKNKKRGVNKNLRDQYENNGTDYTTLIRIRIPAGTFGVLLDVKQGYHVVGIYDSIGDQFITGRKLCLREQDYTTNLTPEERAKVENARKKFIMRKYKKDNFKIVNKLQETKA